ncbi:MAG: ABC transporter ATP-binding protein [Phycisphaerales bacterium]
MLEVTDLSKAYRSGDARVDALRGASLSIDEPGVYAVMGPSGSGKSTLLHLIAGLDRPSSGHILVDGEPVHSLSERELTRYRRTKIGVVFQQFNLIPTMDAVTNVSLPGMLDGLPADSIRDRAVELLKRLGLERRMAHRPDALSGGEQQRVALARALFFEPKLLLADEPTGNLDSKTSAEIWSMLRDLVNRDSITAVMVTHEPAGAAYARRVIVLRDGRVIGQFEVEDHDERWVADRYQRLGD